MSDASIELQEKTLLIQRYTIFNSMGVGGFGITYHAFDNEKNVNCAIKEFFPRGIVTRVKGTLVMPISQAKHEIYEHGKERFLEEAEILQSLNHVPSVVSVYDFFEANGTCYFVMEYLSGKPLSVVIKEYGRGLPYNIVADAISQVGYALMQVHKHNYFHRDISPDNIFVTNSGKIKLIDFGNAKNIVRNDNQVLSVVLKPGFAPPEQYSSKGVQGTFTDVYALASTMYYLLTGKMLPGAFDRSYDEDYIQLKELGFSTQISDAINRGLRLNYRERTQTIFEFLCELDLKYVEVEETPSPNFVDPTKINASKEEIPRESHIEMGSVDKGRKVPVLVLSGGQQYRLPPDTSIIIGRSPELAHIVINEAHISKKHCEIYFDSQKSLFFIKDYSTNGTYVNGEKLVTARMYKLEPGSVLAIGGKNCIGKVGISNE